MVNDLISGGYPVIDSEREHRIESDVFNRDETTHNLAEQEFISRLFAFYVRAKDETRIGPVILTSEDLEEIISDSTKKLREIKPDSPLVEKLGITFRNFADNYMRGWKNYLGNFEGYAFTPQTLEYIRVEQDEMFPEDEHNSRYGQSPQETTTIIYGFDDCADLGEYEPTDDYRAIADDEIREILGRQIDRYAPTQPHTPRYSSVKEEETFVEKGLVRNS
ncbi:MAG: hypothetical protein ACOCXG_00720 [Nanoarchaeota archaeon]